VLRIPPHRGRCRVAIETSGELGNESGTGERSNAGAPPAWPLGRPTPLARAVSQAEAGHRADHAFNRPACTNDGACGRGTDRPERLSSGQSWRRSGSGSTAATGRSDPLDRGLAPGASRIGRDADPQPRELDMSASSMVLIDAAGRRRSPATTPGYLAGRAPHNKGMQYPPDPPRPEESSWSCAKPDMTATGCACER
jgi:hypothetical protein